MWRVWNFFWGAFGLSLWLCVRSCFIYQPNAKAERRELGVGGWGVGGKGEGGVWGSAVFGG